MEDSWYDGDGWYDGGQLVQWRPTDAMPRIRLFHPRFCCAVMGKNVNYSVRYGATVTSHLLETPRNAHGLRYCLCVSW